MAGLFALLGASVHAQVTVVNMIPDKWRGETTQNSEPSLTMNPKNSQIAVGASFMSEAHFCKKKTMAPVFLSTDNGNRWNLVCILPTAGTDKWPIDVTVGLSADGAALYATTLDYYTTGTGIDTKYWMNAHLFGWLPSPKFWSGGPHSDMFLGIAPRTTLYERGHTDQPYVVTASGGSDRRMLMVGQDRAAATGTASDPCTGTIAVFSKNPWGSAPTAECKGDERPTMGTMSASRGVLAGDDAYIVAYRPVKDGSSNDVVVYKRGSSQFDALLDTPATGAGAAGTTAAECARHDGLPGYRVATCVQYADPSTVDGNKDFGQERRQVMDLGIGVHPTDHTRLVVGWAEKSPTTATHTALHFAYSQDGGSNWAISPWVIDHATNPTLAIASDGAIGVLYQELVTEEGNERWKTELAVSIDNLATAPSVNLLASVLASAPTIEADPYLGDYMHLEAVGASFYGVFSASNDLSTGLFPDLCPATTCNGQRSYNSDGHPVGRKKTITVSPSIDPYFFRMSR
jgi:hypothetical protein